MTISKNLQSASTKLEKDQRERSDPWWVTWTALKVRVGMTGALHPPLLWTANSFQAFWEWGTWACLEEPLLSTAVIKPYLNSFTIFLL